MRILFITTFYPPVVIGGWEQLVQEIDEGLQARGHRTHVLTSNYRAELLSAAEPGIERCLRLESDLAHYAPVRTLFERKRRRRWNLEATRRAIEDFDPDVVFVHLMWNLTLGIPWIAEQRRPGRVVYYVANDWPYADSPHEAYWRDPAQQPGRRLLKRALAPLALSLEARGGQAFRLEFEHVLCVSEAIRQNLASQAGISTDRTQVVYNGIDLARFSLSPARLEARQATVPVSLLYAGSIVPHKGVHTAILAMSALARRGLGDIADLTIVGTGHPDYEAHLHRLVGDHGLERSVRFAPRVPRDEMPDLLRRFDALVFPSIWEEPLARMVQEAMASGLLVIGTTTGGSKEVLVDGATGLTFPPEDADALARQIRRACEDADLVRRLRQQANDFVIRRFDIRRMIDEVETSLLAVVGSPSSDLRAS